MILFYNNYNYFCNLLLYSFHRWLSRSYNDHQHEKLIDNSILNMMFVLNNVMFVLLRTMNGKYEREAKQNGCHYYFLTLSSSLLDKEYSYEQSRRVRNYECRVPVLRGPISTKPMSRLFHRFFVFTHYFANKHTAHHKKLTTLL